MNKPIKTLLPIYYSCSEAPSGGCGELGSVPESGIVLTGISLDDGDKWKGKQPKFEYVIGESNRYPRTLGNIVVTEGTDGFEMGEDVKVTLSSWSDATVEFIYCCLETHSMYGTRYRELASDSRFNPPKPASNWGFELKVVNSVLRHYGGYIKPCIRKQVLSKPPVWQLELYFDEKTLEEFVGMAVDEDCPYIGWSFKYSGPITFTDKNGIAVTANNTYLWCNVIWR